MNSLNNRECAETRIVLIIITDCDRHRSKEAVKALSKSSGVLETTRTLWMKRNMLLRLHYVSVQNVQIKLLEMIGLSLLN